MPRIMSFAPRLSAGRSHATCVLLATFIVGLAASPSTSAADPHPDPVGIAVSGLERAHAHNDYEHDNPLRDALDAGFKSVEADVCLVDDKLLLAHLCVAPKSGHTLTKRYLEPLRRAVATGGGAVYAGDPDYFTLLVDIKVLPQYQLWRKKARIAKTYEALESELANYPDILTSFGPGSVREGAVTVIVSGGDRPLREKMQQRAVRYAAADGRIGDVGVVTDQTIMPLISDKWPVKDWKAKVGTAHDHGQRVRFWETPDNSAQWAELLDAKVDYINSDRLPELSRFLSKHDPQPLVPWVSWNCWWRPDACGPPLRAHPTIQTQASENVKLGGQLTDHATVSGLVLPYPAASVMFRLYGPDAGCTSPPVYTRTKTVSISGSTATATSDPFTPTQVGTYRWVAAFSGDANNYPAQGICGEASETSIVTLAQSPPP